MVSDFVESNIICLLIKFKGCSLEIKSSGQYL